MVVVELRSGQRARVKCKVKVVRRVIVDRQVAVIRVKKVAITGQQRRVGWECQ